MGINVKLQCYDRTGDEYLLDHPEWDSARCVGDREMPAWFDSVPTMTVRNPGPEFDGGRLWRPITGFDFQMLRWKLYSLSLGEAWEKWRIERWTQLLNILEKEPEYGVYFSY